MDAPERTPQGFLKVPAHLTRAGVFVYFNVDGSERREWRPSTEVLRADSLATLISAPVTDEHPPEAVTVANRAKYDRGNVGENIVRDGGKVAATLYVKDGRLISAIERGDQREVSCGYTCEVDTVQGVVPDGEPDAGQHYDAVQRSISYNHVAAVARGRAGSEVRMHLDAAGNQLAPTAQENTMTKERIDGVDYEVGSEPHKAAVARRDETAKTAKADADKLQARADAAESEISKLKIDAAAMPARIMEQARVRAELEANARKVLGAESKFDGLKDSEIRTLVAQKSAPEMKLDGKSEAYVEALFDRAIAHADANEGGAELGQIREAAEAVRKDGAADRLDVDARRQSMVERNRNEWKQPLAVSVK